MTPRAPSTPRAVLIVAGLRVRRARRGALIWGAALGAFSALMLALYPSFSEDLTAIVSSLPEDLRAAFGIESYDTPRAFIDGEMYSLLVPFTVALFAIREVARDLAAHEEHGWLDIELATPARRTALALGSFVAALAGSAQVVAVNALVTWLAGLVAGADVGLGALAQGAFAVWLLAAGSAGVALVLCSLRHSSGEVLGGAMAVLAAMYVVNLAATLVDGLDAIRVISAFDHYGAPVREGIGAGSAAAMASIAGALAVLATWLFERHDVRG